MPLRRRFRPLAELEARPLTLPVAHRYLPREAGRPASQDRFRRTPVKGHDVHDPKRLPSTGAPSRPACARCVGTRHRSRGFATAEPASGDLLRYPELALGTAAPSCHPRLITTGSTVQVRRLSTSAITTVLEHDSRFDLNTPLNAWPGVAPLLGVVGQLLALRRAAGRVDTRFRGRRASCGAASTSLTRFLARELRPDPIVPDTSCRRFRVRAGWRAGRGCRGTEVPADPPADDARGAFRTRAAARPPPRRGLHSAHPRCLPYDGQAPEGWRP